MKKIGYYFGSLGVFLFFIFMLLSVATNTYWHIINIIATLSIIMFILMMINIDSEIKKLQKEKKM